MIDNSVTLLAPACNIVCDQKRTKKKFATAGIIITIFIIVILNTSTPRETNPVSYAFVHLSKEAKRQYPMGLRLLFDYLKIQAGDLEERAQSFLVLVHLE
jgi:hypothetical protein